MKTRHYYGIDYLRAIACIAVIMEHMAANSTYYLPGYIFGTIIPSFLFFVYLFMVISAFGLCLGYYDKVKNRSIDWFAFYKKRYIKVLPFFFVLVLIDVIVSPSIEAVIEGFTDLTLLFGLFPNDITVIGVGWFLGVIFAFYLIFPFFCFLLENKTMAWFSFTVSLVLNYFCSSYFHVERTNIVYCLPYFIAGGLVFLYKDSLAKIKWYAFLPVTILAFVLCYAFYEPAKTMYSFLAITVCLLIQAILIPIKGTSALSSVVLFISGISFEIYLCHMFIFRILERLHLNTLIDYDLLQYIVTVLMVTAGAVLFSFVMQKIIKLFLNHFGVQ